MKDKALHVFLILDTALAFDRDCIRGVSRYRPKHWAHWHFHFLAEPFSVRMRPDAVIGRISRPQLLAHIQKFNIPAVSIAGTCRHVPTVTTDEHGLARLAAEHFREHSLKHWAFVGCSFVGSSVREQAFQQVAREYGYALSVFRPRTRNKDLPRGEMKQLRAWLSRLPTPAGILAVNDYRAVDVLNECAEAGIRVPEDIAVLGCDNDIVIAEMCTPGLSSIALPALRIGLTAGSLIEQQLLGKSISAEPVLISPNKLVARRSTDMLLSDDSLAAAAAHFIRDHATKPIRVQDVTEHVHLSRRALEIRFKKAFNRTLHEEIQRQRILTAKRLLSETDLPIGHIAFQAGFSNSIRFSEAFKRETCQTPKQYRRDNHQVGH